MSKFELERYEQFNNKINLRPIEFRAWFVEKEEMVYQSEFDSFHRFHITPFGTVYDKGKLQDVILLQYTGQKDSEDTKIYEGDIFDTVEINGTVKRGVVVFRNGSFIVEHICKMCGLADDLTRVIRPYNKIIGNAFENPDLMEI